MPAVEVHISDIENREEWRRHSVIRDVCIGHVQGKGLEGYRDALGMLHEALRPMTRRRRRARRPPRGLLREHELDCLLVTQMVNVRYLTGFTGTNGACVITPDARLFLTDFRYVEQAAEQVSGFEQLSLGRDMAGDLAKRLRGRAGFEDAHVSVRQHAKLAGEGARRRGAGGGRRPGGGPAPGQGRRRAASASGRRRAGHRGAGARSGAGPGRPHGAGGGAGAGAAGCARAGRRTRRSRRSWPRAPTGRCPTPSRATWRSAPGELVVIDWGARLDGYCSDCTRTVASGEIDDEAREVYELVRRRRRRPWSGSRRRQVPRRGRARPAR